MKCWFSLLTLVISLSVQAGVTIGAYNIRNFDYDQRARIHTNKVELATVLKSLNVDVLSVEEVNNTVEFGNFLAAKMPGFDFEVSRCGGAHGQHLGFIYNKATVELLSFNEDLNTSEPGRPGSCDSGSRPMAIALFKIKTTGQKFYGITVHLKAGNEPGSINKRTAQYNVIKQTVTELTTKTGIKDFFVAGDFNTTEYRNRGSDYKSLTKVVSDLGMTDLTSNLPCTAYWWGGSNDGIESPSLLDHILVTPGLLKSKNQAKSHAHCQKVNCQEVPVRELGVIYEQVSDHCPVTATIQ